MAIPTNRPSNRIFIFVGVILALGAAVGVFFVTRNSATSGPSVTVEIAKADIPAGVAITDSMLTQASVQQSTVPSNVFTSPSQVIGAQFVNPVPANTVLTPALVSNPASVSSVSADTLPPITAGFVALAIPAAPTVQPNSAGNGTFSVTAAADQVNVGYYIAAGDHIDILVDNGNGIRYAFQDVRVLKAGGPASTPGAAITYYAIELPRDQAEIMTYIVTHQLAASQTANGYPQIVKYVLRSRSDYGDPTSTNAATSYPHYMASCPTGKPLYPGYQCDALPNISDTTVSAGTLQNLFGH